METVPLAKRWTISWMPSLSPDRNETLRRLREEFPFFARTCLKIKAKDGSIVPLMLNAAQQYIHQKIEDQLAKTGKVRAIILKGRQQGASTYTEARYYWRTSMNTGKTAYILTHEDKATQNIFGMARRYHDLMPDPMRPATSSANANELAFSARQSKYMVGTAGSRGTGRSSTVQYFHGCLDLETDVVTPTGALMKVGNVAVGQMLVTHTGKRAPVSFISEQVKPVFDVRLKGLRSIPLVATGEHRFWTQRGWQELKDIAAGDAIGYPVREIVGEIKYFPFRQPDSVRPQGGGSLEVGPSTVALTFELGRVVGLYLAEGSIARQSKAPHALSSVTFTIHERESTRTLEWLEPLRGLFRSTKLATIGHSKANAVTAYGRSFAMFMESLCGSKDTKRFPVDWHLMPRDFVEGICLGYIAGDGHSSKREYDRRISIPSIRSATVVGLRDALASLGYGWGSIVYRPGAIRHGRDEKAQWTLRLSGAGVDSLCAKLGWSMPPRRRSGNYGSVDVRNGYAWIPVVSKDFLGDRTVRDFEIADEDHSYCTVHGASHNSEMAFWPNAEDHLAGVGQAVPDMPGTEIILESTANGIGNPFHSLWQDAQRGRGQYIGIFVPWFWQPEYASALPDDFEMDGDEAEYAALYGLSAEQMAWRRHKLVDDFRNDVGLFDQEYPATPALAFRKGTANSLVKLAMVERAMATKLIEETTSPRIMGVDPAEYGDDDTAIAVRTGRVVESIERHHGKGPMEVVGLVAARADRIKPVAINVDCTGIGSGIADRLSELGYPVNRVHFGERAIESEQYVIRRDEMWGEMAKWLEDAPNSMPDDPVLAADLTGPGYTYDSSRRLKLERKEDMKKRGLSSPDSADAVALTFAVRIAPQRKREPRKAYNWKAGR